MTNILKFLISPLFPLLILLFLAHPVHASSTFTVNNNLDVVDASAGDGLCETASGNGECTLRAAIMEANAYVGNDTIILPTGTFTLTIPGSSNDSTADYGDLDILEAVTIQGSGTLSTIIDANQLDRLLDITVASNSININISDLTIKNGKTNFTVGGQAGGAIFSEQGNLTISQVHFIDNTASNGSGGAIYTTRPTTIINSLFSGNKAINTDGGGNDGGAIRADSYLVLEGTTFKNNYGSASALQIRDGIINNSTFSGNVGVITSGSGCSGGAIAPLSFVIIKNTTITDNSNAGGKGGAFCNYGAASVSNTIISNNTPINCRNSTQSNFVHNFNESGSINSPEENRNLDSDGSCFRDGGAFIEGVSARLGPLADNGGLTQTHALLSGSPAIDTGTNAKCLPTDQRGLPRPKDGNGDSVDICDIGSYELQEPASNAPPTVDAGGPYAVNEGESIQVTATGNDPENGPLVYAWDLDNNGSFETPGQTVTFSAASLNGPDSKTIQVQVTDNGNLTATDQATVNITNIVPTLSIITVAISPVQVNGIITASASFSDPGVLDTHTASWNWGDGNTSPDTVNESNGSGSVTENHLYANAGVYTIILTISDGVGSGTSTYQYVAVYDPVGGFLTGSGKYNSQAGWYNQNPQASGEVKFGISAQYQTGSNIPTGQSKINFNVGNLDFAGSTFQWLVVSGTKATVLGNGTINGNGNYTILISGIDGGQISSNNLIRVKISDSSNNVIYDTQSGASDSDDPITPLTSGHVKVH